MCLINRWQEKAIDWECFRAGLASTFSLQSPTPRDCPSRQAENEPKHIPESKPKRGEGRKGKEVNSEG